MRAKKLPVNAGSVAATVVALHEAACLQAGRGLTLDEMRGLLERQ